MVDLNNSFTIEDYLFKNYLILNEDEQKMVLDFRNNNRKWMINQHLISLEEHLNFIDKLGKDKTKLYFLVYKDNIPFISIDFHDINYNEKEAYWGYFLGNENYRTEVLKIEKIIIYIAFEILNLNNLLCINDANNKVINIHKFFGFKEIGEESINDIKYIRMKLTKKDYLKYKEIL